MRTKGSFSFVNLTLAQLQANCSDPTCMVTVSRKWAEGRGFTGLTAAPAKATTNAIQGRTPETKVAAVVVDLDEQSE